MLFNSLEYYIFLPTVFILHWFIFNKNLKLQNVLILVASYIFYGWWDWRFLSLILFSTVVDYFVGLKIHDSQDDKIRKSYLWVSILFNLGLLGFFKYFNFFIDSWMDLLGAFGYEQKSVWTLNVILPIGISFYTFQTMSYSLDIYHNKFKPTKDFISFGIFVSFFPQLVAGPIERASNLLPQILTRRVFKYEQGVQGLRLILWGLFKKIVIADSLGIAVDKIFENYQLLDGGILFLGLFYFSFQVYCDFSGYSDIAIGTSKLLGFELASNFKFPYFSRNISEFWRKWHISLSSWFKDYLYIPLGGSKHGKWKSIRNIIIIFLISGFWHGSSWKFIMWGFIQSLFFLPSLLIRKKPNYQTDIVSENNFFPSIKELLQMGKTFLLFMTPLVFFRSETLEDGVKYLILMISKLSIPIDYKGGIIFVIILLVIDWLIRKNERLSFPISKFDYIIFPILGLAILEYSAFSSYSEYIYFQF